MDIRDAAFNALYDLMSVDKNVVFMTADTDSFIMRRIQQDFPDRFINIGVSEQAAIDVASGLAMKGKFVFVYSIASFILGRGYEHLRVVIGAMKLPVCVIGLGAGLSFGKDGSTHHATHDIALMHSVPEITIFSPCDEFSANRSVFLSRYGNRPAYIRLDKGGFPIIHTSDKPMTIVYPLRKVNIISTGYMVHTAKKVARELELGMISVFEIPFCEEAVCSELARSKKLIVIEEHCQTGGLGAIVQDHLGNQVPVAKICLPDKQIFEYGKREYLLKKYELDYDSLLRRVKAIL